MGLGAALLLVLLLSTDALRSDLTVSRWRDIVWLAWAGTLAYLIHQFEEHGIDAEGATYAFRSEMCRNFGFPDIQTCPVPFVAEIVYHAIMIGTALAFVAGRLDLLVLDAIQVVNPALILLIVARLERPRPC